MILAALILAFTPDVVYIPTNSYRPNLALSYLDRIEPKLITGLDSAFRGYRPIETKFVQIVPFSKVIEDARTRMDLQYPRITDQQLAADGDFSAHLVLKDRVFDVRFEKGRLATLDESDGFSVGTSREMVDLDRFVTTTITERPRIDGPMPSNWPEVAKHARELPAEFSGFPGKAIAESPVMWLRDASSSSSQALYHVFWAIKGTDKTVAERLRNAFVGSSNWTGDGPRAFQPNNESQRAIFGPIEVQPSEWHEASPKTWSSVELAWYTPQMDRQ